MYENDYMCYNKAEKKPKGPSIWRLLLETVVVIGVAIGLFKAVIYLAEISNQ